MSSRDDTKPRRHNAGRAVAYHPRIVTISEGFRDYFVSREGGCLAGFRVLKNHAAVI